ncbi:MAG: FAD-binding oxidoreductase [Gammaproteobacteria bacterium]
MPAIPARADIVIIGGGIIGCSAAYYLAKDGVSVALCEKGEIAAEQSGRNWGFVRKQGRAAAELPLMLESERLWSRLEFELQRDLGFVRAGTLYLSDSETSHRANLAWLEHARAHRLDTRHLNSDELSELAPQMRRCARGALYTASDARAEPDAVAPAFAAAAAAHGAAVLRRCAVRELDIEGGRVAGVVTERGRIRAPQVVCAGGAWSSFFCRAHGLRVPQLKVIGSVMRTAPAPAVGEFSLWSRGLGMRRRQDGGYNIACGGRLDCELTPDCLRFFRDFRHALRHSKEEIAFRLRAGFFRELAWEFARARISPFEKVRVLAPVPNQLVLRRARAQLARMFPQLAGVAIAHSWAGVIDVTPDELPLLGAVDAIPGLFLSTGYSGHGFGIGPGAGLATAQLVSGKTPCADLSAFRPGRFG